MTVRVALLGAGRIGKTHAKAISVTDGARLVAVADAAQAVARAVAERYQCDVRTIDAILTSDDVDAVVICTPTDTHADLTDKAAQAGKSIFCEKPIDLSLVRVKDCLEVVEKSGARLMVGFNRRFDPHFATARQAVEEGRIGAIEMVQIISRDPGPPPPDYIRTSGGIFRDMTIHDFDMARFVLGEEPRFVTATASVLIDPDIAELGDYDSVSVVLMTGSGRHCTISNSRRTTYGYDQRLEVHGANGVIAVENQSPLSTVVGDADGYVRPPLHDFFMTRYAQAYAAEIAAFVDAVATDTPVRPSGEDGLRALALADAAIISVNERRTVAIEEILN